jgi:hypothetical protein
VPALAETAPSLERTVDVAALDRDELDLAVSDEALDDPLAGGPQACLHHDAQLEERGRGHEQLRRSADPIDQRVAIRFAGQDRDGCRRVDDEGRHRGRPSSS